MKRAALILGLAAGAAGALAIALSAIAAIRGHDDRPYLRPAHRRNLDEWARATADAFERGFRGRLIDSAGGLEYVEPIAVPPHFLAAYRDPEPGDPFTHTFAPPDLEEREQAEREWLRHFSIERG